MSEQINSHDLFFAPSQVKDFYDVLTEVQEYISNKYASLILDNNEDGKQQIRFYIQKYLTDNRITVEGHTESELIDRLYTEMTGYSFLTRYIFSTGGTLRYIEAAGKRKS